MYNSNKVAERIKLTAKNKGISIKKLLEDIGLNKNSIDTMKTCMPKSDSLAKIADYLECSVDYLMGRVDNPAANENETELLKHYRSMNLKGQEQVFIYTKNISQMPEYKKCDDTESMNVG